MLKGYLDDSRTDGQIWAIAGYIGGDDNWASYEASWPLALGTHGAPYFHRREMGKPTGPFAKWYPAEQHEAELAAFQTDLAKVIGQSGLRAFGALTRIKDLDRFNAEQGLRLEAYPLAAYACMLLAGKEYPRQPVELIFDHVEKVTKKLGTANQYATSDNYYGPDGVFKKVAVMGLPEKMSFREVPAIQAADFWVWEWRKHQLKISDWFEHYNLPEDWDARWLHMQRWLQYKPIVARKSARALLERAPFIGLIWDYKNLCDAHKARNGVWSLSSSARGKSA